MFFSFSTPCAITYEYFVLLCVFLCQAEELQQKLAVPGSFGNSGGAKEMPCVQEQSVLLKCLKENKANSLACKEAVDAYSRCAMSP